MNPIPFDRAKPETHRSHPSASGTWFRGSNYVYWRANALETYVVCSGSLVQTVLLWRSAPLSPYGLLNVGRAEHGLLASREEPALQASLPQRREFRT